MHYLVPTLQTDISPFLGAHEPASAYSHLLAVVGVTMFAGLLVRRAGSQHVVAASIAVFWLASVFLLAMSGTFHLLSPGTGRDVLGRLDVDGVFFLVAGTYTPMHVILFRERARWAPLVLIWAAAITGATLRTVFADALPPGVGLSLFLLMGWAGAISGIVLWRRHGYTFIELLLAGGLAYTAGAAILAADWPTLVPRVVGPHELWHGAVLTGLGLHWAFVARLLPRRL